MKCKTCNRLIGNSEITLFSGTNRVKGHFCNKVCAKNYLVGVKQNE